MPIALEPRSLLDRSARAVWCGHGATEYLDALREHVGAAQLASIDQSPTLTSAELRVLHYLPTNLSPTEIAARL
jgi:hypothetical protein